MRRILAVVVPFAFAACGSTGQLDLQLSHDALQTTNAYAIANGGVAVDGTTTAIPATFDSGVASVIVPVADVDVHLAGDGTKDEVDPATDVIRDDDGSWHNVAHFDPPQPYDIASLGLTPKAIGTVDLPTGKVTQIRLEVAAAALDASTAILTDAVTLSDANATKCDLVLPQSAVSPGIKIDGLFKALRIEKDAKLTAELNLQLNEVLDGTVAKCTYRLDPVLRIEMVK